MVNVAAVIVTRGDVDLEPILDSLPREWEQVVWDNGVGMVTKYQASSTLAADVIDGGAMSGLFPDLAVYGRYAAIAHTDADLIFVQDDDCILAPESFDMLLAAYQPGHIVANMPDRFRPHYPDSCLVGFGALFDRDLPYKAFERWWDACPRSGRATNGRLWHQGPTDEPEWSYCPDCHGEHFHRTCDVVFTTLTPRILVDAPVEILDYAHAPNRMWKQPGHVEERARTLELARKVRDANPSLDVWEATVHSGGLCEPV